MNHFALPFLFAMNSAAYGSGFRVIGFLFSFLVLSVLAGLFTTLRELFTRGARWMMRPAISYPTRWATMKSTFTPAEKLLHQALSVAVDMQYGIVAKPHLRDVLEVAPDASWLERLIARRHADEQIGFLLCDPLFYHAIGVIELDYGNSGHTPAASSLTPFLRAAFERAGVPVLKVTALEAMNEKGMFLYDIGELREQVEAAFGERRDFLLYGRNKATAA